MALAMVRERISGAVEQMSNSSVIDEQVLNVCVNDIASALLESGVNSDLVHDMQNSIKNTVASHDFLPGEDKLKFIKLAIFGKLCQIFDTGKPSFTPEIRRPCVVLIGGLQGSWRTTSSYACYHKKEYWRPALVIPDSFQESTRNQLMHKAEEARIPLYVRSLESDLVNLGTEGIRNCRYPVPFRDLTIVATTDRHTREATLFEEMLKISEEIKEDFPFPTPLSNCDSQPNLVVFVLDSSIGQAAAFDQARAFKQSFPYGAIILAKMDVHATGLGILNAVATAKVPVIFVEKGENSDVLEPFAIKPFVSLLLGLDESFGFEAKPQGRTMSTRYTYFLRNDKEKLERIKAILGAMTKEEVDGLDYCEFSVLNPSCIQRISEATGYQVRQVEGILAECKRLAKIITSTVEASLGKEYWKA